MNASALDALRRCTRRRMKKHVVRKNIYAIQFSHISFTQTPTHTAQMLLKEASLHAPPPPSLERRCVHARRPGWSKTGQSDRSPLISAELVRSPLHASRRAPPARPPLDPRWLARQTHKSTEPPSLACGGTLPRAASSKAPRVPRQRKVMWMPYVVGHVKHPANPFGPHAEHVEDLGLDDAVRDIRNQHLQCSGR